MQHKQLHPLINKEIEHASYEVSDYILDKLAQTTGIHRKKLNLLQKAEDVQRSI